MPKACINTCRERTGLDRNWVWVYDNVMHKRWEIVECSPGLPAGLAERLTAALEEQMGECQSCGNPTLKKALVQDPSEDRECLTYCGDCAGAVKQWRAKK